MRSHACWISVLLLPISLPLSGAEPGGSEFSEPAQSPAHGVPPWGDARRPMLRTPIKLIAAIDVDGDGQLSESEISEIPSALAKLDLDNNGSLDSTELGWWPGHQPGPAPWQGATPHPPSPHRLRNPGDLAQSLLKHDADSSGGLSAAELPESFQFLVPGLDNDGGGEADRSELARLGAYLATGQDGEELQDALLAGEPLSAETTARLQEVMDAVAATLAVNNAQIASVRRSEWYSYAFTVAAMLIGVISFGHLLSVPPPRRTSWNETDASPDATRPVLISLGLICVLSVIDLFWTTARSGSLHFQEMNPLGSQLLLDGVSPLAFKVTTLAVSVLLLFVLRRYRGAQLASWWMCMVCTLLTFRWIVLDSAILS